MINFYDIDYDVTMVVFFCTSSAKQIADILESQFETE